MITVHPATDKEVASIHRLLAIYAAKAIVLERSEDDIRHYLANFVVASEDDRVLGCVAVRDFGNNLLEVRSLVVDPECHKNGIGRKLVEFAIKRLESERPKFRLFALTYQTEFFLHLGFHKVGKELFPEKIWSDCINCPKKEHCDEDAVMLEKN